MIPNQNHMQMQMTWWRKQHLLIHDSSFVESMVVQTADLLALVISCCAWLVFFNLSSSIIN